MERFGSNLKLCLHAARFDNDDLPLESVCCYSHVTSIGSLVGTANSHRSFAIAGPCSHLFSLFHLVVDFSIIHAYTTIANVSAERDQKVDEKVSYDKNCKFCLHHKLKKPAIANMIVFFLKQGKEQTISLD